MFRLFCNTFLLVAMVSLAHADEASDAAKACDGMWLATTAEFAGVPFPEEARKTIQLEIADSKYTVLMGTITDKGTLKFDPSASPKSLDVVGTDGPNKGKMFPAIYETTGDTLRICYDLEGKTRPAAFKTEPGTKQFLVTYHRKK